MESYKDNNSNLDKKSEEEPQESLTGTEKMDLEDPEKKSETTLEPILQVSDPDIAGHDQTSQNFSSTNHKADNIQGNTSNHSIPEHDLTSQDSGLDKKSEEESQEPLTGTEKIDLKDPEKKPKTTPELILNVSDPDIAGHDQTSQNFSSTNHKADNIQDNTPNHNNSNIDRKSEEEPQESLTCAEKMDLEDPEKKSETIPEPILQVSDPDIAGHDQISQNFSSTNHKADNIQDNTSNHSIPEHDPISQNFSSTNHKADNIQDNISNRSIPEHDPTSQNSSLTSHIAKDIQDNTLNDSIPRPLLGEKEYYRKTPSGIQNLGNTCYMNSVLQCLMSSPIFVQKLANLEERSESLERLNNIYRGLESGKLDSKQLQAFKRGVGEKYAGSSQQDAFFFLTTLIRNVAWELNTPQYDNKEPNIPNPLRSAWYDYLNSGDGLLIDSIFCTVLLRIVRCSNCKAEEYKFGNNYAMQLSTKNATDLEQCLKESFQNISWPIKCKQCKIDRVQTTRIWKMADVLILQLQKSKNGYDLNAQVNKTPIYADLALNLGCFRLKDSPYSSPEYKLNSFVKHYGQTLGFGHYTSVGWREAQESWYSFNDTYVHHIDEDNIPREARSEDVLILFYENREALIARERGNLSNNVQEKGQTKMKKRK